MFQNYLKTAFRNIRKHKGHAFINISGLAVGMACCILIMIFVFDELSYDKFHENHGRIYRVTRKWFNDDGEVNLHLGHVAPPVAPLLENDFPEIEHAVRLIRESGFLVGRNSEFFEESRVFFAEQDVFKVFSFPLKAGDPETALQNPFSFVISEDMAKKYFGEQDPLGKPLQIQAGPHKADMMVTGVMENIPHNSHFHADFFGSFKTYEAVVGDEELQRWSSNNYATYLLMPENYDINRLKSQLDPFIDRHMSEGMSKRTKLELQELTDIHLYSHLDSEIEANSDITYVYVFSVIAFFVLLIGCVNFMNLSTARSAGRAKEVGMRKVVGAQRDQLIRQFLSESMLTAVVSLGLSLGLVYLALPGFSRFVGKNLSYNLIENLHGLGVLLLLAVSVGLLAGLYPALFLSGFKPVRVLRDKMSSQRKGMSFRTVLVVFQFSISIILIICVSIVSGQLDYMRTRDLGFEEEQVAVLPASESILQNLDDFKNRLLRNPGVLSVSAASRVPSGRLLDSAGARVLSGETSQPVKFRIAMLMVDYDYIPTFKMELAAGRNFSRQMGTDPKQAFIVNETAAERMGWESPEQAIGKGFGYGGRIGRIIGVVSDFHFESLHQEISPLVMFLSESSLGRIAVRISPQNIPQTMGVLKKTWAEERPDYPFSYYFVDEKFDQQYKSEEKLQQTFRAFAFLAIFIGCLGLFGLASYSAERRTKEIGIRKVLGAPTSGLAFLLSREFTKWVILANVFAWPAAYWVMSRWLQNFPYRSGIRIGTFLLAGALAWAIALLTVSYQAVKASLADPVESLKYE
ncbi:MAG: FtsX-like permease family protein [Candidatus Aminicenantes bacterium]|nr:FtsX-like permease family protein [Candidatus Aminicenantes bacterium]